MKKRGAGLSISLFFSLHCMCWGGCTVAKITNRVVDETGKPIQDAHTWVSWEVAKTLNPWDGTKSVNESGKTNRDGERTFSNFTIPEIWIGARLPDYYETHRYYTFTSADERLEKPWHPTVTLVLRKIQNPIPMYAKKFFERNFPAPEFGYDLIKGDFLPPHGKGEIADCMFKFELESEGTRGTHDYKRREHFSLTFPGDFNGIVPITNTALFPDSVFVWPREADEGPYSLQTLSMERSYCEIPDPKKPKKYLRQNIFTRSPDNTHFFFRIRAEKNPDGTFKSALYGKIDSGRSEIFTVPSSGEIKYRLKQFSYYVNPTRNDRNMEFDPNENLMYPKYKVPGQDKWEISPLLYKDGEVGVGAP